MSFSIDITKFATLTGLRLDAVVRKLGLDIYTGILVRSPVDTGRFRGENRIGVVRADRNTSKTPNKRSAGATPGGPPSSGEISYSTGLIGRAKFGQTLFFTNNLPYAIFLEQGSSSQAPAGVYSQTFEEAVSNFRRSVEAVERAIR